MGILNGFCVLLLLLIVAREITGSHYYHDDDDDDDECEVVRLLSRIKKDDWKYVGFHVESMRILHEFKDGQPCRPSDYGFHGSKVYAKDGCRAEFEVCEDSDRHKHYHFKYWHRRYYHGRRYWHRRHRHHRYWHRHRYHRHGHRHRHYHRHHHRHHERHRHIHYHGKNKHPGHHSKRDYKNKW